jgi:hypothetical protein
MLTTLNIPVYMGGQVGMCLRFSSFKSKIQFLFYAGCHTYYLEAAGAINQKGIRNFKTTPANQ